MLKDKTNEQLFSELTTKEAAAISGGEEKIGTVHKKLTAIGNIYQVGNATGFPIYLDVTLGKKRWVDYRVNPGRRVSFKDIPEQSGLLEYDNDYCRSGIQYAKKTLSPNRYYELTTSSNSCTLNFADEGTVMV